MISLLMTTPKKTPKLPQRAQPKPGPRLGTSKGFRMEGYKRRLKIKSLSRLTT